MERKHFLWAGLLVGVSLSPAAWADELGDLRKEVDTLRQELEMQRQAMEQDQQADESLRSDLQKTIQALQAQVQQLTAAQASASSKAQEAQPKMALSQAPSEKAPHGFERLMDRASEILPEWDAQSMRAHEKFRFSRYTPTGLYADPTSFFFIHAYNTVTYADFQKGLNGVPGGAEQVLVAGNSARSGKHEAGFRNDSCLFIGSEITENLKGLVELHLVGNALDPILTESKLVWAPFDTVEGHPNLRLIGGRYWWPFGIHNSEWFSAVNPFNLQSPAATEVVPAHWNELGVMAEGEWAIAEDFGMTYLVSVGQGTSSFELGDNVGSARSNAFDHDSNLTVTSRVGLFPWIDRLSVGASVAAGALRRGTDTSYGVSDPRRYEADLVAYGFDASYALGDLSLNGYWNFSTEDLVGHVMERLDRNGGTLDVLYVLLHDAPLFKEVSLKGRLSTAKDVTLTEGSLRRSQYGIGLNARPHEHFLLKAEYFLQDEREIDEVSNNGFSLSGTVEF